MEPQIDQRTGPDAHETTDARSMSGRIETTTNISAGAALSEQAPVDVTIVAVGG